MVSKLAAALLAPLLIAILWPAPQPPPLANPTLPAATLGAIDAAPTPTMSGGSASNDPRAFRIVSISQLIKTGSVPAARYPHLGRYGARNYIPKATTSSHSPRTALTRTPPKVALYNNLNSPGMDGTVNGAFPQAPPDSTGAIGPSNYVEMVNSALKVWTRNLAPVSQTSLAEFIGDVPGTPYCDPQIQWDPSAGRWLYVFLYCNQADTVQFFVFGWSRTADPSNLATGWCAFGVRTEPSFFDFPKLGHNTKYMIIGGNMYDTSVPSTPFVQARIVWIPKPANGVTSCPTPPTFHYTVGPLLNGDGTTAFTPVPVNTTTTALNGYVVSAHDPSGGLQTKLAVWHIDSGGALHSHADLTVASFNPPAPAPETGSTNTIDTLDGRLTQAVGDPTAGIWTQHTIDGSGGRSMLRWYEIKVSSGGIASLANEGNITSPTDFVFNGAISPRSDAGGAAVIYNRSSATIDPVIAAQIRLTATASGTMEPGELVLGTSAAADTDFTCNNPTLGIPCRWGDYAGASPDPVVKSVVWGTSEVNTAVGATPAWADRNFALSFVTTPHAPTAVAATAADHSAYVSWTPSTFVPSSPVTSYTITSYVGVTAGPHVVVGPSATTVHFPALTNGVTYTFTVIATNSVGDSPESVHSNPVTPTRKAAQAAPATPSSRPNVAPAPTATPPPRP